MEDILEFIAEVLFDISVEVIQNKKISKWIRYPLFGFISVLYTFLIFILLYITISLLQRSDFDCFLYKTSDLSIIKDNVNVL